MNPNTGSFGAAISNGPQDLTALKEAMQRRGVDTSALDQMSGSSAGGATPMPQPVSDLSAAQAAIPTEAGATAGVTAPTKTEPTDPELASAIDALGTFVKTGGQTRRDLAKGRIQGII